MTIMAIIDNKQLYDRAVETLEDSHPLVNETTPLDDTASIGLELLSNMVADYSEDHNSIGGNICRQLYVDANVDFCV